MMLINKLTSLLCLLFILFSTEATVAQFTFENSPALDVINTLEKETGYRFLYRESQLADISLSFSAQESTFIDSLTENLFP
ncbi:MAG TPA: hypothetical protein DEG32_06180, partial [Balneolaceae bacterium]|nr:hypothetical protein [Balneolaceae bacterium]